MNSERPRPLTRRSLAVGTATLALTLVASCSAADDPNQLGEGAVASIRVVVRGEERRGGPGGR